ncbi:MAG: UDP-N-acetylmuramoyl-tripeptide--D-alanyl-D-alanine ligase [Filifactoraceae bacterium]
MENMFLQDIITATKGKSGFDKNFNPPIGEIQKDSRLVNSSSIYLALQGEKFDGHDFIASALENGAIAVISQWKSNDPRVIVVEDTYKALKDIASYYIAKYNIFRLGVTGSSGKTTTKDMLYYALSESKDTHRNVGNLNSEVGLPLTVLDINKDNEYGIFEMGMYNLGEIDYLAEIVKPQIAIITNVGLVHLESLKTQENIFKAKMEIANYMTPRDILVVNGDDRYLSKVKGFNTPYNVVDYGFSEYCDYRILSYEKKGLGTKVIGSFKGDVRQFYVPALGEHNIMNAMSVLAVCEELNLDYEKSIEGLKRFKPSGLRMEFRELNDKLIINDSYNANPDSMRGTIPILSEVAKGRRVAILGDMRELGDSSKEKHRELAKEILDNADVFIAVGNEMQYTVEKVLEDGMNADMVYHFKDSVKAGEKINSLLKAGDTIFVKGSRGIALETIVDKII